MNRFVSLLLVALSLAAVGLAQPARAQWTITKVYYDPSSTSSTDSSTTLTTTPVGTIKLTSTPTGYPNNAAGSYNGTVKADYTCTGGTSSPNIGGFNYTDTSAVSGSCTGPGSANSNVGGFHGTTVNTPNSSYGGTNSTGPTTFLNLSGLPTVTRSYSIGAATSDSYMGSATANASATFGAPS